MKFKEILNIPNLLSIFRLCLIPFIIYTYCSMNNYSLTILIILISGLSDILDGIIARKYNMVTDFGKMIDPITDK